MRPSPDVSSLIVLVALLPAACTPAPLDFPDWTIPVHEGTPIIEYAAVPMEERTEILRVEKDLVLTGAFNQPFFRPRQVALGPDGRVYVLDSGNFRVVAFDDEGNSLLTFGQQGQGPGEFSSPDAIVVVGDTVVVNDYMNSRLSVFDLEGGLVVDHRLEQRLRIGATMGVGPDMVLTQPAAIGVSDPPEPWIVGLYSVDGTQLSVAVELQMVSRTFWRNGVVHGSVPMRAAYPGAALSRGGTIYATNADEYQVLVMRPNGEALWALRVAYTPPAPSEEQKAAVVEMWRERMPELGASNFTWPERYAAIENLEVDGEGNLYVFPHTSRTTREIFEADGPVPVDVYSPAGERLFSGMIAIENWDSAIGDHLYRIETDPESEERVVARYRLVEQF